MKLIATFLVMLCFALFSCHTAKQTNDDDSRPQTTPNSPQEHTHIRQPQSNDSANKSQSNTATKQPVIPELPTHTATTNFHKPMSATELIDKIYAPQAPCLHPTLQAMKSSNTIPGQFNACLKEISDAHDNDALLRLLYEYELQFGASRDIDAQYQRALNQHVLYNALPVHPKIGVDLTGIKRLGGGSSLVYKLLKNKDTVAAYKPFQKRYQSNYRSEIAAYRLCPAIKCGFDIPANIPIYFDYQEFSGLYARNKANPKSEYGEIIPSRLPNGSYRINGTLKAWVPAFADFPIEIKDIWMPWLNPGTIRDDLSLPLTDILPRIAQKHALGNAAATKLSKQLGNCSKYSLARQISNLIVFDYLTNNWDRFSGSPKLYGVNCQIVDGRFMSIDNGATFSQTPHPKPEKHLKEIQRFSRLTYEAIRALDKNHMLEYLFPEASDAEKEKFETFWTLRQNYLNYVSQCLEKNGEDETFFFE